ncbi:hypothetical protein LEP1GSC060_1785 [Leptospira weilii serovar Ranarum str. ICFT]|uniref:Uncharacterized protein n=1 Tax=Leptospira weilii serovar Ranarum str. ICFT TaxID=1218598 RepID=N1WGS2_9LEPT|nr:hypothetical protein LEP1GSC060_1785 [Leptospira weilii serovar Ranarum str. ICFT]
MRNRNLQELSNSVDNRLLLLGPGTNITYWVLKEFWTVDAPCLDRGNEVCFDLEPDNGACPFLNFDFFLRKTKSFLRKMDQTTIFLRHNIQFYYTSL